MKSVVFNYNIFRTKLDLEKVTKHVFHCKLCYRYFYYVSLLRIVKLYQLHAMRNHQYWNVTSLVLFKLVLPRDLTFKVTIKCAQWKINKRIV